MSHSKPFKNRLLGLLLEGDNTKIKYCFYEIAAWPIETSLAHIATTKGIRADLNDRSKALVRINLIDMLCKSAKCDDGNQGAIAARRLSCFVGDENFQVELLMMSARGFVGSYRPDYEPMVEEAAQAVHLLGYGKTQNKPQRCAIRFLAMNLAAIRVDDPKLAVRTAHQILDYAHKNEYTKREVLYLCRFLIENMENFSRQNKAHAGFIVRDVLDIMPGLEEFMKASLRTLLESDHLIARITAKNGRHGP